MKVGNIIDIKINSETGKIESLILEKKKFSSIFNSNDEIEIYWTQINKIGEDIFKDMPNPLLELLNYKRRLKKEVTRRIKDLENGGK